MLVNAIGLVITTVLSLSPSVLGAGSSNSSQNVIPNAAGDTALDQAKVNKYKALLGSSNSNSKFNETFRWTDILDDYTPLNVACSARCLTCAPGCNPACCLLGSSTPSDDNGDAGSPDPSTRISPFPQFPGPRFPGRPFPIPPLACPCNCEAGCPPPVVAICCFTPPARARPDPPPGSDRSSSLEGGAETGDTQQSLLDNIQSLNPRTRIWGRPGRPLACPCFCEATCPFWIQTICCTTPGSSNGARKPDTIQAPKLHETLVLITETAHADPVSVLAAVNVTVFDSFITLNLVQGLERGNEITYNDELKTFEITLNVVVGPQGKEVVLAQTFLVVDGSLLLEEEQILVGTGFLGRAGGVGVEKKYLTGVQEGLPVLTGVDV